MLTVAASGFASLDEFLRRVGTSPVILELNAVLPCPTSQTIPANVIIQIDGGNLYSDREASYFDLTSGVTITIFGPILAPPVKIFNNALAGQGTVILVQGIAGEIYAEWWGANAQIGSSFDNYIYLQAAISSAYVPVIRLQPGSYHYNTAPTIPSNLTFKGVADGGSFQSVLRPNGCAAFLIDNIHHSTFEKLMIWPRGTAQAHQLQIGPSNYCYNITFRDIRWHYDADGTEPTTSVIRQVNAHNVLHDNVTIRADNPAYFEDSIFKFEDECGSATLIHPDFENAYKGINWLGGRITVVQPYTEGCVFALYTNPSGDANPSMTVVGGVLHSTNSGPPIGIDSGTKNLSVKNTHLWRPDGTVHGHFYGQTGNANIVLDYANQDPSLWTTSSGAIDPSTTSFPAIRSKQQPGKFTSINVTVGTLSAGDITGADSVNLMSTNATPGTQTTRTAAQMIADHGSGITQAVYRLRITNTGAGTFTLGAGSNVTLTGTMTIAQNTWRDFVVTLNGSAGTAVIQSIGTGTYS